MMQALCVHGGFDIQLAMKGDLEVDCHHSIEDLGIVMGMALHQALEDKAGIRRYGSFYIPMDEALGFCALDVSGRAFLVFDTEYAKSICGDPGLLYGKRIFPGSGLSGRPDPASENPVWGE